MVYVVNPAGAFKKNREEGGKRIKSKSYTKLIIISSRVVAATLELSISKTYYYEPNGLGLKCEKYEFNGVGI